MNTIEKLRAARMDARKRGADMTQALLYAAFAIIVLISVLGMYQVVTLNSNKTTATRTMSMASGEARTLYRNADDFGTAENGLTSAKLIAAGAVPTDATTEEGGVQTIKLPYQGTVEFGPATDNTKFQAVVEFENSRSARALCTFLSAGEPDTIITGPMGSEYVITTPPAAAADCTTFTVTYER